MKKRRMHQVYLSDYALQQLAPMQQQRSNDFVFPAQITLNAAILRANVGTDITSRQFYRDPDETEPAYQSRLTKRMACRRTRAEFELYNLPGGRWTLYDMRRTVATRLQELGFDKDMVGRVLAHAPRENSATDRYARYSHWEMRCKALDLLGEAMTACSEGRLPVVVADNILQLRKKA